MKTSAEVALTLSLLIQGCAPASQGSSQAASEPVVSATATDTAPSAIATASAASSAAAPADTRVRDACAKLCDRVRDSCPEGREAACRTQCEQYETRSKGCEAEGEAAFTCLHMAKESFCDSVVPSDCVDAFKRMQRCHKGETQGPAAGSKLPEDWRRVDDTTWGTSMLMPPGAAIDAQAKSRTWKASRGEAVYEIVELERPKKLDQQSMVKLVIAHLGVSCQKEMRLTGLVETDKLTTTRFETVCSKGGRRYGKLWINQRHVLSLVVRDEPDEAFREAFLEGIK
jgi:hypothetical protein